MGFALYRRAALTAVVVMALALPLILIPIAGYVLALCLGPYLGGRIGARKLPPDWHDFFKLTVGGGWAVLLLGGLLVILGVLAQGAMAIDFVGGALMLGLAAIIWLFFAFGVNAAASLGGLPAPETPPEPDPTPEKQAVKASKGDSAPDDEPTAKAPAAEPSPDGNAPGDEAPVPPAKPRASEAPATPPPATTPANAPAQAAPPPPTLPPRGARSSATSGATSERRGAAVVRSRTGMRSRGAEVTTDEVENELSGIEKRMAERAASEQSRAPSRMGAMARRRRQS